jgi:large subunit ribosomal protein L25
MEKTLVLEAELRDNTGSQDAAKLRQKGRLPAIVYGHKKESLAISLDAHDFVEGLHHGHRVLDVKIGKQKETTIVKEIQYDHLGRNAIHVDLMRVDVTETIKVMVPIELKGTAKGTHEGGIIAVHADHLEVECRVTDIPDSIAALVKDLGVGDSLHAGAIEMPAGIKLVSSPEMLVVSCRIVAAAKTTEELEAEVPVAPEVITEVKKTEEEGEESTEKEKEKEKK